MGKGKASPDTSSPEAEKLLEKYKDELHRGVVYWVKKLVHERKSE